MYAQSGGRFTKPFFQWQMTKFSDKSADNQSEARISVAYNKNCHLSLMTSFVKCPLRSAMACEWDTEQTGVGTHLMPISSFVLQGCYGGGIWKLGDPAGMPQGMVTWGMREQQGGGGGLLHWCIVYYKIMLTGSLKKFIWLVVIP